MTEHQTFTFHIPHPPIPLGEIRPTDIWLLLAVGVLWEFIFRMTVVICKRKPASLLQEEAEFQQLQLETAKKRRLGVSAFVETSKMERQVLAKEKKLQYSYEKRQERLVWVQRVGGQASWVVSGILLILYLGVPVITLNPNLIQAKDLSNLRPGPEVAAAYTQAMLFPISYFGFGIRVAKFGLSNASAIPALLVMWSAQETVSKIMDGVEALMLS
jgi:hypothetical protein